MARGVKFVGDASVVRSVRVIAVAEGMLLKALGLGTLVIAVLALSALLDQDSGFAIWEELSEDLAGANARVEQLIRENDVLRGEIELTRTDPTAIDRAIREELDLALPGEVVVRFLDRESAGRPDQPESGN